VKDERKCVKSPNRRSSEGWRPKVMSERGQREARRGWGTSLHLPSYAIAFLHYQATSNVSPLLDVVY